jgi:hypothetical protein
MRRFCINFRCSRQASYSEDKPSLVTGKTSPDESVPRVELSTPHYKFNCKHNDSFFAKKHDDSLTKVNR